MQRLGAPFPTLPNLFSPLLLAQQVPASLVNVNSPALPLPTCFLHSRVPILSSFSPGSQEEVSLCGWSLPMTDQESWNWRAQRWWLPNLPVHQSYLGNRQALELTSSHLFSALVT